jgi:hypothetical protein
MTWETTTQQPASSGSPSDFFPGKKIFRPGDAIYSTNPGFNLWDATNPVAGAFANEYGEVLAAPLVITNLTGIDPTRVTFQMGSSDLYNALSYSGYLATNTATLELQNWSETCVGIGLDGTIYTSGPMTNIVRLIAYSGIWNSFVCTNEADTPYGVGYVENYLTNYWPIDVWVSYSLSDASNSSNNISCKATLTSLNQLTVSATQPIVMGSESWENAVTDVYTAPSLVPAEWTYLTTLGNGESQVLTNTVAVIAGAPTSTNTSLFFWEAFRLQGTPRLEKLAVRPSSTTVPQMKSPIINGGFAGGSKIAVPLMAHSNSTLPTSQTGQNSK